MDFRAEKPKKLLTNWIETVHPLLIYADLVASGSDRNIETAKIIYEQHISRYLRED
ncbi:MAG: hypothetical protein IMZ46_18205 [Acidobacteria bacterium]|nr:hypothetical protein [Acidobacteriota bacterium]